MEKKLIHIQFTNDNKYVGPIDHIEGIKKGHYSVELSHDEHEDVKKNKQNADAIAKILDGKDIKKYDPKLTMEDIDVGALYDPKTDTFDLGTKKTKYGTTSHKFDYKTQKYIVSHKGGKTKLFGSKLLSDTYIKSFHKGKIQEDMDQNELEDSLVEISKQKLADYIKNASFDILTKSSDKATAASKQSSGIMSGDKDREDSGSKERDEIHSQMVKRTVGINKAVQKMLTKNEQLIDEMFDDNFFKKFPQAKIRKSPEEMEKATAQMQADRMEKLKNLPKKELSDSDKERLLSKYKDIKSKFDPNYQYSDDPSVYHLHKDYHNQLKHISGLLDMKESKLEEIAKSLFENFTDLESLTMEQIDAIFASEEFAQLDEISKDLAGKYLLKSKEYLDKTNAFDSDDKMRKTFNKFKGQQRAAKKFDKDDDMDKDDDKKGMKESFGADILDSIINNKPITAQEQFGAALSNIIKSKLDTLRQDIGNRIYNKSSGE